MCCEMVFVFRVCLPVNVFFMCVLFVVYCAMRHACLCMFICVLRVGLGLMYMCMCLCACL